MWQQCLIGTLITLVIEFVSGYILNIKLGLDIWDYSSIPFNLMGQICLPYGILWFFLCRLQSILTIGLDGSFFMRKNRAAAPLPIM